MKAIPISDSPPSKTPRPTVPSAVRSFTRSFKIGSESGHSFTDVTVDDRNRQVKVRNERLTIVTQTFTNIVKKRRKSRSSTSTSSIPHDRKRLPLAVREQTGAIGTGRIERDVELGVTPPGWSSENKWEQIGF